MIRRNYWRRRKARFYDLAAQLGMNREWQFRPTNLRARKKKTVWRNALHEFRWHYADHYYQETRFQRLGWRGYIGAERAVSGFEIMIGRVISAMEAQRDA